jgi:Arc/MetJ-type ribon-helix-helix transcriptional regulator
MPQYVQQEQYTPFVRPYVEGPVKEYAALQKQLIEDYDDAALQYDALQEAADNMSSLDFEGDVQAKKEAFDFANKAIQEAAKAGDYENRGRLVRKAIKDFSTRYKPVAEQIKARQEAFEAIDKDDKIVATEKAKAKKLFDDMYDMRKGLQKDPVSNNYVGYSNAIAPVKNIPHTVDIIEKINKAMTGAVTADQKKKIESIVGGTGTLYDGMMQLREKGVELFTPQQLQSVLDQVFKDPEVAGYYNFWASADARKATSEDGMKVVNNIILNNAEKLKAKYPEFSKMSEEELLKKSAENLQASGTDLQSLIKRANESPAELVAQENLLGKYNEASNYVKEKYGQVKSYDYTTYSETQLSKGLHDEAILARNPRVETQPFTDVEGGVSDENLNQNKQATETTIATEVSAFLSRSDNPSESYVAGTKQKYKPSAQEAANGVTATDKMVSALREVAAVPGPKQQDAIERLKTIQPLYANYQNMQQIEKEANKRVQEKLTPDEIKKSVALDSKLMARVDKNKKVYLESVLDKVKNSLNDSDDKEHLYTEVKGKRYRILYGMNNTRLREIDSNNDFVDGAEIITLPVTKNELIEARGYTNKVSDIKKEYYKSIQQNTSIPVYSALGLTKEEQAASKADLAAIGSAENLQSVRNSWMVVPLKNGALGEPTRMDIAVEGPIKGGVSVMYVKAKVIPDGMGGKTNGIVLRGVNGGPDLYVPSTQVRNNALVNEASRQGEFGDMVEILKAKSGKQFNLSGYNFAFVDDKGKTGVVKPGDNIQVVFDNPTNRNIQTVYKINSNGTRVKVNQIQE